MKAFLKAGNSFGISPMGYDHYGPRVRDGKYLSSKQKIVVNQTGKILKEAWQWKVSGHYSDAQIITKLENTGIKMPPQKLSKMWRTPFYCGIIVNKMVDEPIKGKWEPLVSVEDFMKVQQILEKNPSGYQHKKDEEERPLTRLLKCDDCGGFMVGYKFNQKNLHYYRCLKCRGVSLNAKTTPKAKRKSVEQMFLELLNQYEIPNKLFPLIEFQLRKLFNHFNANSSNNEKQLQLQLVTLQNQIKQLRIRVGLGQIDKETFDITLEHLNNQVIQINKELNSGNAITSNLEQFISTSLKKLTKLSTVWSSSNLEGKRVLQKTSFRMEYSTMSKIINI